MKPTPTQPPLPLAGRGNSISSLAAFDQDLTKALFAYLGDLARNSNSRVPKDGSEPLTAYAVADLPSAVGLAGALLFASDGRKSGEGAGAGTGVLVYSDGTNWIAPHTSATVTA